MMVIQLSLPFFSSVLRPGEERRTETGLQLCNKAGAVLAVYVRAAEKLSLLINVHQKISLCPLCLDCGHREVL